MSHTFGTVINCMDGRVQISVNDWMRQQYEVDHVDTVTEPGPERMLAEEPDGPAADSMKKRVGISVSKHGSKIIAVAGHMDCAGNPVDGETKLEQIRKAVDTVRSWEYEAEVIGLFIGEDWTIKRIETGD